MLGVAVRQPLRVRGDAEGGRGAPGRAERPRAAAVAALPRPHGPLRPRRPEPELGAGQEAHPAAPLGRGGGQLHRGIAVRGLPRPGAGRQQRAAAPVAWRRLGRKPLYSLLLLKRGVTWPSVSLRSLLGAPRVRVSRSAQGRCGDIPCSGRGIGLGDLPTLMVLLGIFLPLEMLGEVPRLGGRKEWGPWSHSTLVRVEVLETLLAMEFHSMMCCS